MIDLTDRQRFALRESLCDVLSGYSEGWSASSWDDEAVAEARTVCLGNRQSAMHVKVYRQMVGLVELLGEKYLSSISAGAWAAEPDRPNIIGNRDPQRHIQRTTVLDHLPTCDCNATPGRCIVLDPFAGSGTTLQVATHYGRNAIGCELSEEYAALAHTRIAKPPRCLIKELGLKNKKPPKAKPEDTLQRTLF